MAYRMFASPDGTVWQAWDVPGREVTRQDEARGAARAALEQGWICFEGGGEKRRLTPIPARWSERSEAQLWLYCRVAEPVEGAHPPPIQEQPTSTQS